MAQAIRRYGSYKLNETSFRFDGIEPSQDLLEQWAIRLEEQAKAAATLVLKDGFEVVVLVQDGSVVSKVTLLASMSLTALQLLGTDYKIVAENIAWLEAKSAQFANVLVQQVSHDSKLPRSESTGDRSLIIRRSNTGVKRLKDFLQAEVMAHLDPHSAVKRKDLVKKIGALLKQCSNHDERAETLAVLMQNPEIRAAFEAESKATWEESESYLSSRADSATPRTSRKGSTKRTRRLNPVVRRFNT